MRPYVAGRGLALPALCVGSAQHAKRDEIAARADAQARANEGLASQADMDLTCKLGLGYPDGPIERVLKGGLEHHYAVTKALFDTYGTPAYAPPRRAVVAFNREHADAKKRR